MKDLECSFRITSDPIYSQLPPIAQLSYRIFMDSLRYTTERRKLIERLKEMGDHCSE